MLYLLSETALGAQPTIENAFAAARAAQMTDITAAQMMRGSIAVAPDSGPGLPIHDELVARWAAGRLSDRVDSTTGCSAQTDDNGQPLWYHDHDQDPATPPLCIRPSSRGSDASFAADQASFEANPYAFFAFDAVVALAYAVDALARQQDTPELAFTGQQFYEQLLRVSFDGSTGRVAFAENGDRDEACGAVPRTRSHTHAHTRVLTHALILPARQLPTATAHSTTTAFTSHPCFSTQGAFRACLFPGGVEVQRFQLWANRDRRRS